MGLYVFCGICELSQICLNYSDGNLVYFSEQFPGRLRRSRDPFNKEQSVLQTKVLPLGAQEMQ
jgi:hypothetical protein